MSTPKDRILVVDDERDMAESCAYFLNRAGYEVATALSGEEALTKLTDGAFSVMITDLKMPRMSGLDLLEKVKARDPEIEVVVITGFPELETAVQAMRQGALDYITKPFQEEAFLDRVEKALAHRRLRTKNHELRERLRRGFGGRQLVFRSTQFGAIVATLERAARTDAAVLLVGESGTGKELLAHHLHDVSRRSARPFVPLDCTTIPENLIESELFGHVKGAFSGADQNRAGLFQVANHGTLFLDEVGELPLSFQPKLLRAIQEGQVRRVGAQVFDTVDARIVCATNRRVQDMVAQGTFRADLFYRLDVVRIEVPPLRERPEDIELLAKHFLAELHGPNRGVANDFSPGALAALRSYAWPGNVRQLRNAVARACALGTGPSVLVDDLPAEVRGEATGGGLDDDFSGTFQEMKARKVAAIESQYVETLLRRHQGNVTKSAAEAGVSRSAFQKLMQRYQIKSSEYREP